MENYMPDEETSTPVINTSQPVNQTEQFMKDHPAPQLSEKKQSHAGKAIVVIVIILIIAGIIAIAAYLIPKILHSDDENDTDISARTPARELYSSHEKLSLDYRAGAIDVAEYFKQLVYLELDGEKLDDIYISDEGSAYGSSHADEIVSIIKEHNDELDQDLVTRFLRANTHLDYYFGSKSENNVSSNSSIKLAADTSERAFQMHFFTEVKQSKDGHFLIWYTKDGQDKITDAQAETIANTLESAISKYKEIFGIDYELNKTNTTFDPGRITAANRLLVSKGLPENTWENCLNVFIYDTGSNDVFAHWTGKVGVDGLNWIATIHDDIALESAYLAYPYIVVNQSMLSQETSSKQVMNHELFHHYQKILCREYDSNTCYGTTAYANQYNYSDATANFAANHISESTDASFLSDWAEWQSAKSENGIYDPNNSSWNYSAGYAGFVYLTGYTEAGGSISDITLAHTQDNPLSYLQSKINQEQSKDAIAKTAYYALTNDLPTNYSAAKTTSFDGPKLNEYDTLGEETYTLNPGAIKYFKLEDGTSIHAKSDNSLMTYILFGKDKKEIWRSDSAEAEIDSARCFKTGDECYLAYANGDIAASANITATVNALKDSRKFSTRYDNYDVAIKMDIKMGGIGGFNVSVSSVSTGVMDELHQREHLNVTSTTMGIDTKNEIYTDIYNHVSYTSMPDVGLGDLSSLIGQNTTGWIKSNEPAYAVDLGKFVEKLEAGGDDVDRIDDTHYCVTINAQDLQGLVQSDDTTSNITMPNKDVKANVTINGSYISEIDYDLSDVSGIESLLVNIKFSNYNNAGSVYIPYAIIRDAEE